MAVGYLAMVLHAHLPFVRHPEDATVMEEQWLYEAITGTYLPLVQLFEGLLADGVRSRATVSLSAPLINMLTDDLLKERYAARIDQLIELAEKEIERTRPEPHYQRNAQMYKDRFPRARYTWRCHDGNLVRAFRRLQDAGARRGHHLDRHPRLLSPTWTATGPPSAPRCTSPPISTRSTSAVRAQGMWLGECGYVPGVDELLREAAIRYFFVDTHGILFADRRPALRRLRAHLLPERRGRLRPRHRVVAAGVERQGRLPRRPPLPRLLPRHRLRSADGLHRALRPSRGSPHGHRLQVPRHHPRQAARQVGLRSGIARKRAGEHAMHFRVNRQRQARDLAGRMDRPPIIVSPYDAELYGHWWFEGLQFLDDLFRQIHYNQDEIETITPGEYLDRHPTNQLSVPCASSWGHAGYNEYWLNETNAWIYRHLHVAGERMVELSHKFPLAEGLTARALKQAARELMLAQSSDWAFIMRTGTTVPYAERRTNAHILQFNRLYDEVLRGEISERWLSDVESKDNIFPDMDYRLYAT